MYKQYFINELILIIKKLAYVIILQTGMEPD